MSDGAPIVSIIIPCYHAERFVGRCLNSLYRQIFKNFEVILAVDDYHFDNTIEYVKRFKNCLKIKYSIIDQKTSPASARNRAFKISNGKYIAFLDVDDWWTEDKLEKQVDFLENNPTVDLVYSRQNRIWTGDLEQKQDLVGMRYTHESLMRGCIAPHSTIMIRREKFINFDERLKGADDYAWLLDLEKQGVKMEMIDKILCYMDIHGENLTSGNKARAFQIARIFWVRGNHFYAIVRFIKEYFNEPIGRAIRIKKTIFPNEWIK
jgi:glycosyltransferase involved in cell wall biosynthesis